MRSVEILSFNPQSTRGTTTLQALRAAIPHATPTTTYQGKSDLLILWGPGDPARWPAMDTQVAKGGHVLATDLAYWDRFRKFRISIDAPHPQRWVLRKDWPASRLTADGIVPQSRWNPTGPIIMAGIGRKARAQYGHAVEQWEQQMMATAAQRWPQRSILYRRKQADAPVPAGARLASDHPIEQVLDGASLVITWHSNVAVDAIRMGIPVICKDGAAAAVCASTFSVDDPIPLAPAIRARFLANLAWFQWAPQEATACWTWVQELLA